MADGDCKRSSGWTYYMGTSLTYTTKKTHGGLKEGRQGGGKYELRFWATVSLYGCAYLWRACALLSQVCILRWGKKGRQKTRNLRRKRNRRNRTKRVWKMGDSGRRMRKKAVEGKNKEILEKQRRKNC